MAYLEDQGLLAPWQRWSPVSQLMARCVLLQDATWLSIHHTRLHYRGMPDADPQLMLVPAICIPQSFSHSNETRFVPFLGAFGEHGPHSNRAIFENAGKLIARCNQGSPLPFADWGSWICPRACRRCWRCCKPAYSIGKAPRHKPLIPARGFEVCCTHVPGSFPRAID